MENKKQQTAINLLLAKIEEKNGKEFTSFYSEFINESIEIEKQQMKNVYCEGQQNWDSEQTFEQYYNEKFS
jgi:hypothetical protein